MLVWLGGYAVLIRHFMPRIRARSKARAAARAVVTGQVVDTLTNIATVKLFSHGRHEDQAALEALAGYRGATIDFGATSAALPLLADDAGRRAAGVPDRRRRSGSGPAARPRPATSPPPGCSPPASRRCRAGSAMTAMGIFSNVGEIEDGMRTLSPPHTIIDAAGAGRRRPATRGAVDFEDVRFGYGRPQPRRSTASRCMSGPASGWRWSAARARARPRPCRCSCGSTTWRAGGSCSTAIDIRDLTQDALRAQIGMVRQETAMFNRSALENIRYGRPDASEAEVFEAARRAEAHEFILDLRDWKGRTGYAAHLGERGVKLSGGQRQRIALARVILKNAPVLVLDEATSALDSEVEAAIQDTPRHGDGGQDGDRHRPPPLHHRPHGPDRGARGGRIVEEGTHAELLAAGGLYARFWRRQSGGFINLAAE